MEFYTGNSTVPAPTATPRVNAPTATPRPAQPTATGGARPSRQLPHVRPADSYCTSAQPTATARPAQPDRYRTSSPATATARPAQPTAHAAPEYAHPDAHADPGSAVGNTSDLFKRTDLIYGSEIGGWTWNGTADGHPPR